MVKLTDDVRQGILNDIASGMSQRQVAVKYQLSRSSVRYVLDPDYARKHNVNAVRNWVQAHPDRNRVRSSRYDKREAAAGKPIPLKVKRQIRAAWFNSCAYCGSDADSVDHITPLSAGGKNEPANMAACCRSCNSSKGQRRIAEWRPELVHVEQRAACIAEQLRAES